MDPTREPGARASLSRDAFARELELARPSLVCLAASILNTRSGAEDVVQEASIVALRRLDEFAPGTHFSAWMGRIVRLTALNHARARQRSRAGGAPPEELASPARASTRIAEDLDDELLRALAALNETARAALLLRTVLELDYKAIARMLEIPEGTAMSHVHRSREALRRALVAAREAARRPA